MGQNSTKHYLERGHVVTAEALHGELQNYADVKSKTALSKRNVTRFLAEMHELLVLPMPSDLLLAIDMDEARTEYTIEECVSFFAQSVETDVLSKSLREYVEPVAEVAPPRTGGLFDSPSIEVQSATTMEPRNAQSWCPPAQYFSREWSLILMSRRLRYVGFHSVSGFVLTCRSSTKDLNNVSLVCRYLRTVMLKYPPQNWRVIRLDSLEKRTAEDMTQFTEYERLQGCCRLEVGCPNFGNMFKDEDLVRVFANLKHLTALKLLWCHLMRGEGFALSQGLPGALRLRELRLHKCHVAASELVAACPNLTSLGLSDCEVHNAAYVCKLRELKRLIWISSGSEKSVLGCAGLTHLWMDPAPVIAFDVASRMPGLRVCVWGNQHTDWPKLPLVDFYNVPALLGGSVFQSTGTADWELLPQA
jgi:hypothetical protein